jgi:nucleotide-binding universal stress UspA family protein
MTRLQKLVMGSTALKLLNGITALPLIFAGSKPDNPRVLLAFDGSKNAFRAVDFACATLTPGYHSVLLVSVLRTYLEDELRENGDKAFKDLLELPLEPMTEKMNQAVARFHACGFSHEGIQSRIVSNGSSRAGTIVDLAASEDFGTIIAGRKGHSMVRDFALGRVSQKILQLSPGYAVWLIN